jgi:hypothetical protein
MIHYEGLFKIVGGTGDCKFAGILPTLNILLVDSTQLAGILWTLPIL